MKHLKKFENRIDIESQEYKEVVYIDAMSKGVIEYGDIILEINGEETWIEVQLRGEEPYFQAYVDDIKLFTDIGIEMDGDQIKDDKFLDELYAYYDKQSRT